VNDGEGRKFLAFGGIADPEMEDRILVSKGKELCFATETVAGRESDREINREILGKETHSSVWRSRESIKIGRSRLMLIESAQKSSRNVTGITGGAVDLSSCRDKLHRLKEGSTSHKIRMSFTVKDCALIAVNAYDSGEIE
jgi:hypothetical protein